MTRNYGGLIGLNTKGIDGTIDDLVGSIGKEIEAEGGKLEEAQQMGRRQFAYPPKNMDGGHYVNYLFAAEPATSEKIRERLKMNGNVHLQHYQTR